MNRFENHRFDNYEVNAESGCWEWRGYLDSNGYGRIYDPTRPKNRRSLWVHRFSYERFKGEIPEGYEIDHVCQNTACMNPEHLDAVTPAEHGRRTWERLGTHDQHKLAAHLRSTGMTYRDIGETMGLLGKSNAYQMVKAAIRKGHVSADEIPTARRLSEDERSDIRDLHALGVPQGELAAWYRMDNSQISRVCNNVDRKSGQAREAQKREATP